MTALTGDTFDFQQGGVVTSSAQIVDAGASAGDVLTVQADKSIAAAAGGGAQTVECVRFPIAFNTPGIVPQSFPIIAVDLGAQTFTVAGDRTAAFAVGVAFLIVGSTGNDQPSTVASVALVGQDTVIGSTATLFDPTADGSAVVAVGAVVYTPEVGDILLGSNDSPATLVSVSEAWNGTTPTLRVLTESYRQAQAQAFVSIDATVADDPPVVPALLLSASPGFAFGSTWRLWRFTTADPIIATVDNGGLDPGSTQGAGEIVLLILAAQ